jgi:hypothetical protein
MDTRDFERHHPCGWRSEARFANLPKSNWSMGLRMLPHPLEALNGVERKKEEIFKISTMNPPVG